MSGYLIHFFLQAINGEEDFTFSTGTAELGRKCAYGFVALSELRGDVHYECGADVREGCGVKNFVGAEGLPGDGELFEAGKEAAFVAER